MASLKDVVQEDKIIGGCEIGACGRPAFGSIGDVKVCSLHLFQATAMRLRVSLKDFATMVRPRVKFFKHKDFTIISDRGKWFIVSHEGSGGLEFPSYDAMVNGMKSFGIDLEEEWRKGNISC